MNIAQHGDMAALYASLVERIARVDGARDLDIIRDICETVHVAGAEPPGVTYEEEDIHGIPALWCIPRRASTDRVLLHSHAGGTVLFSRHVDRKAAGHLATAAGMRALVLDYRRAPEHKFPAQVDDVEQAYRWLVAGGIRPAHIACVGHSIGGHLAVSVPLRLRDRGIALPGAILSISPWFDIELTHQTLERNAHTDRLLSRAVLEWFRQAWLADTGVAYHDPRVNLLYADLRALPPIGIYYGEAEILAGDAIAFAQRARDAGVDVHLEAVPGAQHSFILGAGRVDDVDRAISAMGGWLRAKLGEGDFI